MTTQTWLTRAGARLQLAGIATARLDALVLLEDTARKERAWLLAHPELELEAAQVTALDKQLARREQHEPLAYIRGRTEFYGRAFTVNQHVLEPRPETETMIDLLGQLPRAATKTVVDVGTGSGAIAITAALELVECRVLATDIDPACLAVARRNCVLHKATVDLLEGDLLEPALPKLTAPTTSLCILANLPYVPDAHQLNQAAMNEPRLAIFGGPDGLDLYRRLFAQLEHVQLRPLTVLTESLPFQHDALAAIAVQHGYTADKIEDFIQLFSKS